MLNVLGENMARQLLNGSSFVGVVAVLVSLYYAVLCFFGYRIRKVWGSITCFLVGLILGIAVGYYFVRSMEQALAISAAIGLAAGILLAFVAWKLYNVGVFIYALVTSYGVVYNLAGYLIADHDQLTFHGIMAAVTTAPQQFNSIAMIIALVVGVIFAVLTVKLVRPLLILSTSAHGGFSLAIVAAAIFRNENPMLIALGAGAVLFAAGLLVQFKTTSEDPEQKNGGSHPSAV